jgi:2-polyprenyl-3-methyl-5-hydroxy-6-metoxy-1,4-benzoquinol methylase
MPEPAALTQLYTGDYYEEFAAGRGMAGGTDEVRPYLKGRLAELARRSGGGRLLDLGCGIGLFVAYARSQGWDAVGVEPSAWAAEEGRRRLGVEIYNGTLEEAPLASGTFDAIHANHVIEHVTDPVRTLRFAGTLLRPGGCLVVEVPQELKEPLAEAIVRSVRGQTTEPTGPYHVVFFSAKGLRIATHRADLRVNRIENTRHRDNLRPRALPFRIRRALLFAVEARVGRAPAYVLWATRARSSEV